MESNSNEMDDILDNIFDKKEDDDLFDLDDEQLKELDKQLSSLSERLDVFIEKRVHPKTQEKLQDLISEHTNLLYTYLHRENQLFYKNGVADGIKLMILVLSFK